MAEDDGGTEAENRALYKPGPHKCRADTGSLTPRRHGHRRQAGNHQRRMAGERRRREHDVADDRAVVFGDE